jgi:hypothetical protein
VTTVGRLGAADRELWLGIARRCPYATYFHTPGWAELMTAAHRRLAVATQAFSLPGGGTAILPLLRYRADFPFIAYESMVPGVYGGPIAERVLAADEVAAILDAALTPSVARMKVIGNPFLDCFRAAAEEAQDFTHVISLTDGFDEVFKRYRRKSRQSYRYGCEAGLRFRRAESRADFDAYYEIYRLERLRWGDQALTDEPRELFEAVARRPSEECALWLATRGEAIVAGALVFYWNGFCTGWHNATHPSSFELLPMNFLLTEIIRDACARGLRWFDFNPSGGLDGVARFKDSFGAARLHFHVVERSSRAARALRGIRRLRTRIARRLTSLAAARPAPGEAEGS